MPYNYPDPGDRVTAKMISSISDPDRWDAEEQRILSSLRSELRQIEPPRVVLDVGAGIGRLTRALGDLIIAADLLEPDLARARRAKDFIKATAPQLSANVYTVESELPEQTYDLVLLSHVIQHLLPREAQRLVAFSADRCRPGGLFYLATTLASPDRSNWRLASIDESGHWTERAVSEDLFSKQVAKPVLGTLPVREFSQVELARALRAVGIELLAVLPFHETSLGGALTEAPGAFRDIAMIGRKHQPQGSRSRGRER